MDELSTLRRILAASSDAENPSAELLRDLFRNARRIAVIGFSRDPAKAARSVPSYLASQGYDVVPVNPNADLIMGRKAHASVSDVEDPLDLVVIFRPSDKAGPFVEEAARRPERPAIWLQDGIVAPREARAARDAGLVVVQDLCTYRVHMALDREG